VSVWRCFLQLYRVQFRPRPAVSTNIRLRTVQGGVLSSDRFHPVTLGGSTSAPLLVRLQDNDAVIIAHRVACLDFFVLVLERSKFYISTIFGWSSRAPPQVAYYGNIQCLAPFAPISMPQDDSKQCEHLLSQEICPRCSNFSHLISVRSQFYLTISYMDLQLPN
jgi:hypothetical protein